MESFSPARSRLLGVRHRASARVSILLDTPPEEDRLKPCLFKLNKSDGFPLAHLVAAKASPATTETVSHIVTTPIFQHLALIAGHIRGRLHTIRASWKLQHLARDLSASAWSGSDPL